MLFARKASLQKKEGHRGTVGLHPPSPPHCPAMGCRGLTPWGAPPNTEKVVPLWRGRLGVQVSARVRGAKRSLELGGGTAEGRPPPSGNKHQMPQLKAFTQQDLQGIAPHKLLKLTLWAIPTE